MQNILRIFYINTGDLNTLKKFTYSSFNLFKELGKKHSQISKYVLTLLA